MAPRKAAAQHQDNTGAAEEAASTNFAHPDQEFASMSIRVDHLLDLADKQVIAVVMSSETAPEAVLSLMDYHGKRPAMDVIKGLAQGTQDACAYTLRVNDRMSYIVVDRALWNEVRADPDRGNGTDMATVGSFLALSTELARRAKAEGNDTPDLLVYNSEG